MTAATAAWLPSRSAVTHDLGVDDVEVEVGGWEHQCCGQAIERGQIVDLGCLRTTRANGQVRLSADPHFRAERRVRGRVRQIHVLCPAQDAQPVLRVPSGLALRGYDPDDDGHLEDPWTGEALPPGEDFLVLVRLSR